MRAWWCATAVSAVEIATADTAVEIATADTAVAHDPGRMAFLRAANRRVVADPAPWAHPPHEPAPHRHPRQPAGPVAGPLRRRPPAPPRRRQAGRAGPDRDVRRRLPRRRAGPHRRRG